MINADIFNISAKPERKSITSHSPRSIIQPVPKKGNSNNPKYQARSNQSTLRNSPNQLKTTSSNELNELTSSKSINYNQDDLNTTVNSESSLRPQRDYDLQSDPIPYWIEQIIINKVDISRPKVSAQINPQIIKELITSLQSIHDTCVRSGKPDESKRADFAIAYLKQLKIRLSENEAIEMAKIEVAERLQAAYDERDRMMELLRTQEKRIVARFEIEKNKLAEKQKNEMKNFEKEWLDQIESNPTPTHTSSPNQTKTDSQFDKIFSKDDEDLNQNEEEEIESLTQNLKTLNQIAKAQDEENLEKLDIFINGPKKVDDNPQPKNQEETSIKPSFSKFFEIEDSLKIDQQKTSDFNQISHIKQKSQYVDRQTESYKKERRLRYYNRTSAMLRELRQQTQCLLAEKRYDEARFVNERATELEKEEVLSSVYQIRHDYEINLLAIEKRHHEEQEMLEISHKRKFDEHKKLKQETVQFYDRRIDKIKNELRDAEKGKARKTNRDMTRSSMKRQQTNSRLDQTTGKTMVSNQNQSLSSISNDDRSTCNANDNQSICNANDNQSICNTNDDRSTCNANDGINDDHEESIMIINSNMVQNLISASNGNNQITISKAKSEPELDMKLSLNRNARRKPMQVTASDIDSGFNLYNGYSFASKINKGSTVNLNTRINQSVSEMLHIDVNRSINTANKRNPLMKRRNQPLSCSMPITARRQIRNGEFTSLQLPPLNTKQKVRKAINDTQKQFEVTKKYI